MPKQPTEKWNRPSHNWRIELHDANSADSSRPTLTPHPWLHTPDSTPPMPSMHSLTIWPCFECLGMDLFIRLSWKQTAEMTRSLPSSRAQTLTPLHRLVFLLTTPHTPLTLVHLPSPTRLSTWIYPFPKLQDLLLVFLVLWAICSSPTFKTSLKLDSTPGAL